MKTATVIYSMCGNPAMAARKLAEELTADLVEITGQTTSPKVLPLWKRRGHGARHS